MVNTYLSIDVATKSLALGIYTIDSSSENVDNRIVPIALNVVDLNPEKKSKEMKVHEKAILLKKVLSTFDAHIPNDSIFEVLIEYQMNANHMSNAIFNMIAYHYAGRAVVHTVFPSLKNSIHFHSNLSHSKILGMSSANYVANKNHCKYNFMYFMIMFGHTEMCTHIKSKNLDDIADTFMQCVAFHYRK